MILMLTYSRLKKELTSVKKCVFEVTCKLSDDDWDFFGFCDKQLLNEFLEGNPIIDMLCVDVSAESGIELAEKVRSKNSNTYIIILADTSVSPMLYIKPTIMASSLIMRPITEAEVKKVFLDAARVYLKRFCRNTEEGKFLVINNRDGRQLVPYDQIVFFESRSKKIFVDTEGIEYSFYDTLDNLEQKLSDDFVRCHRSFIVSRSHIKQIKLSQNVIILDDDRCIPLSRSYKKAFKGEKQ